MSISCFFIDEGTQKEPVIEFVRDVYSRTYGTTPPSVSAYAGIIEESTIVGCLGLQYADEDGKFPLEYLYGIERKCLSFHIRSDNSIQLGRLISKRPELTSLIVYSGLWHAARDKREYGLLEHTLAVHRIIKRMGLIFHDLPFDSYDLRMVAREDLEYYIKHKPRPYLIELKQALYALESRIDPALCEQIRK